MSNSSKFWLSFITLLALVFNFMLPLSSDEAYYWSWSQHLSLSYYDGSPMIAYLIYISTAIFGNTVFGVKFVSVVCYSLSACLIYRFSRYLFDEKAAGYALMLFLLSPAVQVGYSVTTYDAPQILFWSATLFSFYLALEKGNAYYFYLSGLCAGLLLLSKYTGILLLGSLFVYLFFYRKNRAVFKNWHLYLALALAFLVFSPVIIWNQEHQWVSFLFQLQHGSGQGFNWGFLGSYLGGQALLMSPVFFIGALVVLLFNAEDIVAHPKLSYLVWCFAFTFLFFLYKSCFVASEINWAAPAYISLIIAVAYLIRKNHYYQFYYWSLATFVLFSIVLHFPILTSSIAASRQFFLRMYGYPEMMLQASYHTKPPDVILSDSYQNASEAYFYLPHQPQVYVISPTARFSEFNYWSADLIKQPISQAWYIGEQAPELNSFFKACHFVQNLTYQSRYGSKQLVLYHCQN